MKILILGNANSSHVCKWANSLVSETGGSQDVTVFGLSAYDGSRCTYDPRVRLITPRRNGRGSGSWRLLKVSRILQARRTVRRWMPDIVHAHYATSYGLLGVLARGRRLIVSSWGSDVMEFPRKSCLHRLMLRLVYRRADVLTATGNVLREAMSGYTTKDVKTIAFGIDLDRFRPGEPAGADATECITIGTARWLEPVYGADILIRAFAIAHRAQPELNVRLLVGGDGSQAASLRRLCSDLGVLPLVEFCGFVPPDRMPECYRRMTIYATLSRREGFGVSALEAAACGLPVIATAVGGLTEVVKPEYTGLLVAPDSPDEAASAIVKLARRADLRREFGKNGREWVEQHFDWRENVRTMAALYCRTAALRRRS